MEDELQKTPLADIFKEMSKLDQEIDLKILRYEKLRLEVIRRFPPLEEAFEFKPKVKKLGGGNNG